MINLMKIPNIHQNIYSVHYFLLYMYGASSFLYFLRFITTINMGTFFKRDKPKIYQR